MFPLIRAPPLSITRSNEKWTRSRPARQVRIRKRFTRSPARSGINAASACLPVRSGPAQVGAVLIRGATEIASWRDHQYRIWCSEMEYEIDVDSPGKCRRMSEKHRVAIRLRWSDPAQHERQSAITRAQWADPVVREKMVAGLADPTKRARMAAALRENWADPIARKKRIERIRASHTDTAAREKAAAASRARWADPTMREKMIARMKAARACRKVGGG